MTNWPATIFLTIVGIVIVLLIIAGGIDHAEREARCKRKGGSFIESGRYGYVCLKPGTVIE